MDEGLFDCLKTALQEADIDIEQCMYYEEGEQCRNWIVDTYAACRGIKCEECKKYVCSEHGKRTENRNFIPVVISSKCNNC